MGANYSGGTSDTQNSTTNKMNSSSFMYYGIQQNNDQSTILPSVVKNKQDYLNTTEVMSGGANESDIENDVQDIADRYVLHGGDINDDEEDNDEDNDEPQEEYVDYNFTNDGGANSPILSPAKIDQIVGGREHDSDDSSGSSDSSDSSSDDDDNSSDNNSSDQNVRQSRHKSNKHVKRTKNNSRKSDLNTSVKEMNNSNKVSRKSNKTSKQTIVVPNYVNVQSDTTPILGGESDDDVVLSPTRVKKINKSK